jgi:hypothetical protein
MTKAELKLLVKLLDMSIHEFSNHGCNDFDLVKDGGLTEKQAYKIQQSLFDDKINDYHSNNLYSMDWLLMLWLKKKILKELENEL